MGYKQLDIFDFIEGDEQEQVQETAEDEVIPLKIDDTVEVKYADELDNCYVETYAYLKDYKIEGKKGTIKNVHKAHTTGNTIYEIDLKDGREIYLYHDEVIFLK